MPTNGWRVLNHPAARGTATSTKGFPIVPRMETLGIVPPALAFTLRRTWIFPRSPVFRRSSNRSCRSAVAAVHLYGRKTTVDAPIAAGGAISAGPSVYPRCKRVLCHDESIGWNPSSMAPQEALPFRSGPQPRGSSATAPGDAVLSWPVHLVCPPHCSSPGPSRAGSGPPHGSRCRATSAPCRHVGATGRWC
jgi:hypothetical protein